MTLRILVTSWPGERANKNPFSRCEPSAIGGAELQVRLIANELGTRAQVSYANLGESLDHAGPVRLLAAPRPRSYTAIRHTYANLIRRALHLTRPHIVLSYLIYPCGDLVASVIREECRLNRPILATIVGSWQWLDVLQQGQDVELIPVHLTGTSLTTNDLSFVRSPELAEAIERFSDAQCALLRPIARAPECRTTHPMDRRQPNILWCGRLARPKRCDLLLRAFYEGIQRGVIDHSARLRVLGDGPEAISLQAQLLSFPPSVVHRIRFLGHVAHDTVSRELQRCRVAVHLSESEGYGTAPVESVLCNIPTVIAGFPSVHHDLAPCRGLISCGMEVQSIIRAIQAAWECARFDAAGFVAGYKGANVALRILEVFESMAAARRRL